MKQREDRLNKLQIKTPCPASWEEMDGDASRRHCEQCDLQVHNLAEMKRDDAEELMSQSAQGSRVCVRVEYQPGGELVTAETPAAVRFGPGRLAAAALALGAGLAGCNSSQADELPTDSGCTTEVPDPEQFELLGEVACPPELEEETSNHELLGRITLDREVELGDVVFPPVTLGTPSVEEDE